MVMVAQEIQALEEQIHIAVDLGFLQTRIKEYDNSIRRTKTLEITEWVLKGSDPTNSDEFASKFRMVIGTNDAGVGIVSDNSID